MLEWLFRPFGKNSSSVVADAESDGFLMGAFVEKKDEEAFAKLVERYGGMVLGVCRRTLGDLHEAEDAFQATFVVLAQRPPSLASPGATLAGWLHTVAYRIALRARNHLARQRALERTVAAMKAPESLPVQADSSELRQVLDEEVSRLPEKFRLPFILCHLQGLTNEDAAQKLTCPLGTVLSRLSRARERLRGRLQRRGIVLSTSALAGLIASQASCAVPAALATATVHVAFASGTAITTGSLVGILAQGALHEMFIVKIKTIAAIIFASLVGIGVGDVLLTQPAPDNNQNPTKQKYEGRFLDLWKDLHNPKNGYFSPDGIPYHSSETLIVEAPDYGHLTTSEAFSYWIWLEAAYGHATGDWTKLAHAWDVLEKHIIPTPQDQPTNNGYKPNEPATLAFEFEKLQGYPAALHFGTPFGRDPIAQELKTAYGSSDIYGMHWLLDVDNWYGYGRRGDGKNRPSYINTFQRGPKESVWHTIPHPSWEAFNWGGRNGFLDLFIKDNNYARQWRYTDAPDADARLVQAMYWAHQWAKAQGKEKDLAVSKAAKMGDYLRYSFFDKYFKKMGCENPSEAGANGYESAHYLISWYYAWGGPTDANQNWAFRIGCSHNHQGYQNPMAAWVLSQQPAFKPASANGSRDWAKSLERQLEFYRWLQSSDGAIAGGATNSWNGRYEKHSAGASTFHGMAYDWQPVWHDPPSNQWFGFQCWSMERVAEYYHATGDDKAKTVLDKWIPWAMKETKTDKDGSYAIPSDLEWTGQPDMWNPAAPGDNKNLHVKVVAWATDIGVVGSFAKTLLFYSAGTKRWAKEDGEPARLAHDLLDRAWKLYRDDKGLSSPEARKDYTRIFEQEVYVPAGWQGKMANGDVIKPGIKFLDIRSRYKDDPDFARVKQAHDRQQAPEFRYHRFWAQVDFATACAFAAQLTE